MTDAIAAGGRSDSKTTNGDNPMPECTIEKFIDDAENQFAAGGVDGQKYVFTVTVEARKAGDDEAMQTVTLEQNCDYRGLVLLQSLFLHPVKKLTELGVARASK